VNQPVVVITGAVGGIGSATVGVFRDAGWYVVGIDVIDGDARRADRSLVVDVADEEAIGSTLEGLRDLGRIDALINNAAILLSGPILETASTEWDRLMAVNVRAAYLMIRSAVPMMRDVGGAIVNVSSVHAVATTGDMSAYATAKAGIIGLTRASALDLARYGIRVNAILPGAVDTSMLARGLAHEERVQRIAERTPLGRIGEPREIAEAVLFLADDQRSSFITGQTLVVDGGALARLSIE
jgi:NAD(P)-dependent dehydrogenase (short-subunit alcohol dehydrogenase family)